MQWLNNLVDQIIAQVPEGEILIESGASPSGTYHFGHLREIITADAVMLELKRRGRQARHIQFVDDLDALRKIPINIPTDFEQYLGMPLCDIPAPDGSERTFADYFADDFIAVANDLGIDMAVERSHLKYRAGFFVPAIEKVLDNVPAARKTLETVAGRQLDEHWSPIQIMEAGRLKNRRFTSIDPTSQQITYQTPEGEEKVTGYAQGEVKLDWRLDWPARWWMLNVHVEPFGRDHATKGGSYDTGVGIMEDIFKTPAPIPVPYDFINRAGDTKKMSASKGTGIEAKQVTQVLPAELVRYFVLVYPPSKRLYFDQGVGVMRLFDEFAALLAKADKTPQEEQLLEICRAPLGDQLVISQIPFSHLVASYQSALRDPAKTIEIIKRTEHAEQVEADIDVIMQELQFIDKWLDTWAPEEAKFALREDISDLELSDAQQSLLKTLADKVRTAPDDADGNWFHQAIYELKDETGLSPKEMFTTLYTVLINQESGPRAGWFLSILPRDWLIERLQLKA